MTAPRVAVTTALAGGAAAWYYGSLDPLLQKLGLGAATMGQPPAHEVYPDPFYQPYGLSRAVLV